MKKLIFATLILVFLCSCKQDYNILSYQENDIVAYCTVNNKFDLTVSKAQDKITVEILKPENLGGITFEFEKENSYAIKDEMKIPINNENIKGIYALSRIFSLDENGISTVGTNNVITFDCNDAIYTVTYGENNLPLHMEIRGNTFEYSVDLKSIRLNEIQ